MSDDHSNRNILDNLNEDSQGELTYKGVRVKPTVTQGPVGPKGATGQQGPPAVVSFDGEFPNEGLFEGLLCYRRDLRAIFCYTIDYGWIPISATQIYGETLPTTNLKVGMLFWDTVRRIMYIYSGNPLYGEGGWVPFGAITDQTLQDTITYGYVLSGISNSGNNFKKVNIMYETITSLQETINQGAYRPTPINAYEKCFFCGYTYYSGSWYLNKTTYKITHATDAVTNLGTGFLSLSSLPNTINSNAYMAHGCNNRTFGFYIYHGTGGTFRIEKIFRLHLSSESGDFLTGVSYNSGITAGRLHTYTLSLYFSFCGGFWNPNKSDAIIKFNMDNYTTYPSSFTLSNSLYLSGCSVKSKTHAYLFGENFGNTSKMSFTTEAITPISVTFSLKFAQNSYPAQNLTKAILFSSGSSYSTIMNSFNILNETATPSSLTITSGNDYGVSQQSVF